MDGRIKRADTAPRLKFPLIGKIKCGKLSEKGFPMSTDYFIPTGNYTKYFTDVYGEKPHTLQVVFLEDDPSLVCDEKLVLRDKAGALVAKGDGLEFLVFDPASEKYKNYSIEDHPDILERLQSKYKTEWKTRLTMRFILPRISGIAGHWEVSTGGVNSSIPDIIAVFDKVREEKGFIRGVIFDLHVTIHKSNKPKSKSRFPVLSLVPNHSQENLELIKGHKFGITNENLQRKNLTG